MMASATRSRFGGAILTLFSLPFLGVGGFAAYMAASAHLESQAMQSWAEAACTVNALDLESNTSTDSDGDTTTTYRVTATYTYEFEGRTFTGDRVGVIDVASNIGDWHELVYEGLRAKLDTGQTVYCYVDPANPASAVLNRDLTREMYLFAGVFIALFGVGGLFMFLSGVRGILNPGTAGAGATPPSVRGDAPVAASAEEGAPPTAAQIAGAWQSQEDWRAGEIVHDPRRGSWALWGFAIFWSAISCPIAYVVLSDALSKPGEEEALFVLIFPAIGMLLMLAALMGTLSARKFGASRFVMASTPGVLGGALRGVVRLDRALDAPQGFAVALSLKERWIERRTTTSGGRTKTETKTHEKVHWQDRVNLVQPIVGPEGGMDIPVLFALPYDAHESQPGSEYAWNWELKVEAALEGFDYSASFIVPCFRTEASRADFALSPGEAAVMDRPYDDALEFEAARIFVEARADGALVLDFPAPRNRSVAIISTLLGGIFTAAGAGLLYWNASWLFGAIMGGFGVALDVTALFMWCSAWHIEVRKGELRARGGLFARGPERTLSAEQLASIDCVSTMQVGDQQLYDIVAAGAAGKKIALAKRLDGQRLAQKVVARITAGL